MGTVVSLTERLKAKRRAELERRATAKSPGPRARTDAEIDRLYQDMLRALTTAGLRQLKPLK
jgi:hypothetical protein